MNIKGGIFSIVVLCSITNTWAPETESSIKGEDDNSILPFVVVRWFNKHLYPEEISHDRMKFSQENVSYFAHSFPFSTELYLCPKDINDYCLYVKKFQLWEIKKCEFEAEPVIEPVLKENENEHSSSELRYATCGPGDIGKLYKVQYELCIAKQDDIMEKLVDWFSGFFQGYKDTSTMKELDFPMYTFCYDHEKKETIYTEHLIFSPTLLEAPELEFERKKKFSMMTYGFECFSSDFITLKDAFDKIEKNSVEMKPLPSSYKIDEVLGHDRNEFSFVAQKLVPDENMAFALWRKATFHYANIRPFLKALVPLWNRIWKLIRSYIKSHSDYDYEIFTGAYRKPSENPSEVYKIKDRIYLPDFWIIVIQETIVFKKGVAIMVSDYYDAILESYCNTNMVCSASIIKEHGEHIRCCQITRKIEQLFGLEFQKKGVIKIDGIIE